LPPERSAAAVGVEDVAVRILEPDGAEAAEDVDAVLHPVEAVGIFLQLHALPAQGGGDRFQVVMHIEDHGIGLVGAGKGAAIDVEQRGTGAQHEDLAMIGGERQAERPGVEGLGDGDVPAGEDRVAAMVLEHGFHSGFRPWPPAD
ncbi:hypothetical protein QU39_00185, partial [Staphylococcus aureus]